MQLLARHVLVALAAVLFASGAALLTATGEGPPFAGPVLAHDDHDHDHDDDDHDHHDDTSDIADLSPWAGDWVSAYAFLRDPAGEELVDTLADHLGHDWSAIYETLEMILITSFDGAAIDGDTIVYQTSTGALECVYRFERAMDATFEEFEFQWLVFHTDDADCADYRHALFTPPHGEGSEQHFHMRYGTGAPSAIATDDDLEFWWPSLYSEETTARQFADDNSVVDSEFGAFVASILGEPTGHKSPESPAAGNAGLVGADDTVSGPALLIGAGLALMTVSIGAIAARRLAVHTNRRR